ncbi:response regulator [Maribacter sp. MAR_2009_72]|uniref:response regulator n=1 Tax=Maribacter sp. MAR_2009_72 TaxID=1250050 RepID=UPI00119AC978|nr:response regulator [Maribacter sp. MAR_2009_72]TVZ17015.1 response regulator receiver domain-containing protein [Maribacter sp. MAR_2009_72]
MIPLKKKLSCILLIDDDHATNYIHKRVINKAEITEKIVDLESGYDALKYLEQTDFEAYPRPDIIFLDINMPGMDGWEFLEGYENLSVEQRSKIILVMLTTSLNPDDKNKSDSISTIDGFKNKPLTHEILQDVIDEYFADHK